MEKNKIRILNILEQISGGKNTSQREISKNLNMSLGLVNSFIKQLLKRGFFKITTPSKNRFNYILTPKGIAEKTRLTYEHLQYSFEMYRTNREKIIGLYKKLKDNGHEKIVLYGARDLSEIFYVLLQSSNIKFVAVIDPDRCGQDFMGNTVIHPRNLLDLNYDKILITHLPAGKDLKKLSSELGVHRSACAVLK